MLRLLVIVAVVTAGCSTERRPEATPAPIASAATTVASSAPSGTPIVLTRADQVEAHVGKVVTLEGVVTRNKMPSLLGVDIEADETNARGKRSRATGMLTKSVVTKQEIDDAIARKGQFANRGPGTFYALTAQGSQGLAPAIPTD